MATTPERMQNPAAPDRAGEPSIRRFMVMTFGTPVLSFPWPDSAALNAELRSVILDAEKKSPGLVKSNIGGWHSDLGIFKWDAKCIATLHDRVRTASVEMTRNVITRPNTRFSATYHIDGWANVVRPGDYHLVHNHPNNLWSGVYYVSVGEPEPDRPYNGQLELLDPRLTPNMVGIPDSMFEMRYTVRVAEGLMIVFPSWLKHYVHPFYGNGERISVAFNVLISDFKFLENVQA
jgi:uncharacterized protein (TIGR02466 family)